MRSFRVGASAVKALTPEWLHANNRVNHIVLDVIVANLRQKCLSEAARVNAGLVIQRQAVIKSVDLHNTNLYTASPTYDLEHRAKGFVLYLGNAAHFINMQSDAVCYFFRSVSHEFFRSQELLTLN